MLKKQLLTLLAVALTLMSCTAQSQLLRDLPTGNDVSKVVLGSSMMKLADRYGGAANSEYGELFKELKSLEVYSSDNKKISAEASQIFNAALEKINSECAVMVEEDGEISNIYTITAPDTNEPEGIIIYNYDISEGELSIVIMKGKMNLSKLEKLAE